MQLSSAQDFVDLEIRIDPLQDNCYPVTLVVDGARQFPGFLDASILPWVPSASPEEDGERLFNQLFATLDLRTAWGEARGKSRRRIRLVISPYAPKLHVIPWELLREHIIPYPAVTLAAAGDTPFSRYLYGGWEPGQPVQGRPIRILVAIANPKNLKAMGLGVIDVDLEWKSIQGATTSSNLELDLLSEPCTLSKLVAKAAEGFHILHLVCHGAYSESDGKAALFMADEDNRVQIVKDHELADALRNHLPTVKDKDKLRLVFLASCETATRSPADAFRGLAPQLVNAGVPVVLAMQDLVPVETARDFAGTFYQQLLQHGQVDLASNQARAHVSASRLPGSAIPVLFMRLPKGQMLAMNSLASEFTPRATLQSSDVFVITKPISMELVRIPAGRFVMGSNKETDKSAEDNETPQHHPILSEYFIGRHLVTNGQYAAFVEATKRRFPDHWSNGQPPSGKEQHPVVYVTWEDALLFCNWLTKMTARTFRLPSEAHWEKAASWNPTKVSKQLYPWGNSFDPNCCNSDMAKIGDTTEVGKYSLLGGDSVYGISDLAGNVQEWTSTSCQPYPYRDDSLHEVHEPCGMRVLRGGSFGSTPKEVRTTFREFVPCDARFKQLGFRVVMIP